MRLPKTRGGFVDIPVVLVLVVVLNRGAIDHRIWLVFMKCLEQFRRPILETLHEHSFIITGVFTGAVSYKTVRVYTVFVEVLLASTKTGNQSRTFEADGVLVQSVQLGVAGVHPGFAVVVGVDVQAFASGEIRFVGPGRLGWTERWAKGAGYSVDNGYVDGTVGFVVFLQAGWRVVVAGEMSRERLGVSLVGR